MPNSEKEKNPNAGYLINLCSSGSIRELRQFLENLQNTQALEERVGFFGYTPLHEATSKGHVSAVRLLLIYGSDPNATANGFYTPLHLAASSDSVACVEELLRQDADITRRDEFGKTPYETAVIHRCKRTAKLLKSEEIKKLARENSPQLKDTLQAIRSKDISPTCMQEALQAASRMGHVNAINSIILAGATENLVFTDCIASTLQFYFVQATSVLLACYAAQQGYIQLLKYFLDVPLVQEEKDAALNQLPSRSLTHPLINNIRAYLKNTEEFQVAVPLQMALHNKHKDAVKVLLLCINCNRESREIDWRKLGLKELDSSLFKVIRWTEKLSLPFNLLSTIPSSIVDLHKLCRLDLRKNNLQKVPSGLFRMNCLRNLDLSENKLTDLPRKGQWSPSLKTLYLSDNLLESLPDNMASAKLKNLYLAKNRLYEVPDCVCEILTLENLDLSDNYRLTRLPEKMGKLTKIASLRLDNLEQVTDPPEEIKRNGVKTIMYLRTKLRSAKGYYSMKLMLVGRAAQGKTTLMHRLMLDNNYCKNSATNGISMKEFSLKKQQFGREFVFKVWDFGGQEDYYATHQCFLSTLSLYILVWNLGEGEAGAKGLEGWLDTISARAPGSSLVIVGTHLDKVRRNPDGVYEGDYVRDMHQVVSGLAEQPKYRRIYIKAIREVSCAVDSREGIDELRNALYDVAANLFKDGPNQIPVMGEPIPHSYFLVEELIANKKEELNRENKLPYMRRVDFEALVSKTIRGDAADVEDPDDLKEVTRFMHERGILMHYDDPNQDLQDYYFIDPTWLCDLMARIVTLHEANPHFKDGVLSRDEFGFIFKGDRFHYENYPQFVRLLNRFQIACSLDENRLLVPSKLPEEKPTEATSSSLRFITVKRFHSLPFMPYGFWDRFIARFLYYTKDMVTSGCSRDLSPGSPRSLLRSPFDLDPCCCKCPLGHDPTPEDERPEPERVPEDISPVPAGIANGKEPQSEGTGNGVEPLPEGFVNGKEPLPGRELENENPENHIDSAPDYYEPHVKYVDDDSVDGIFINGVWFGGISACGREGSDSEAEYGESEEEEDSYGSSSRRPHVIRHTGIPRRRSRKLDEKVDFGESQSYTAGDFRKAQRQSKLHENTSAGDVCNSLPETFMRYSQHLDDSSSSTRASSFDEASEAWVGPKGSLSSSGNSQRGKSSEVGSTSVGSQEGSSSDSGWSNLHQENGLYSAPDSLPLGSSNSDTGIPNGSSRSRSDGSRSEAGDHSKSSSNKGTASGGQETSKESTKTTSSKNDASASQASEEIRNNTLSPQSSLDEVFVSNPENTTNANGSLQPQTLEYDDCHGNTGTSNQVGRDDISEGRRKLSRILNFLESPVHEPDCPCLRKFDCDDYLELPSDLSTLIDRRYLRCWRSGVCLNHPDTGMFFLVSHMPDPSEKGRELIITEVSPNRVGRRVLSYIVDHIDTLIREWYPDLSFTDGRELLVRQSIPCCVCERLGIEPTLFSFVHCQTQSTSSDSIMCPNHVELEMNLHLVAPDIMLHDVDPDLLLSKEEIVYEESDSSLIGSGGFGKVRRGKCRGQPVAIKFFDRSDETDPLRHYFEARKELNVLRRVRKHPYLINIIGVSLRPLCLVLELAEKGSLQESLFSSMQIHRIVFFRVAYQVADALSFLHSLGVIYRDLKPENILVWSLDERDDLHVKLIDFGTANFATSAGLVSVKGSLGNHAPEMLDVEKKEAYTEQVDVYSYAILLYEMIARKPPFLEIEKGPEVNEAVVNGERPKWGRCSITGFGLPSLTELMLQCWASKPTKRPKSAQVAKQVRMPAFQALLGKSPIPSEQSVRHACVVLDAREIWMACSDYSGNNVLVFDCTTLALKHSFSVDLYQELTDAFNVQCMLLVDDLMLIAFRGTKALNFVHAYATTAKYKLMWSIPFDKQVTCMTSNEKYLFVGMNEGIVRGILKREFKKNEKKRRDINIKVEHHRILSVTATNNRLWVSFSKYIKSYSTKETEELEAFNMESMWYGGTLGFEENPQTQINNLTVSFDGLHVWSTCRCMLTKWCLETRKRMDVDCMEVVQEITKDGGGSIQEADTYIVCLVPVLDTVWVGTISGHILIFSAEEPRLITWFHPFQEIRTLSVCLGPGPCGTEQCFVVSTGKGLRPEGLGTSDPIVCPLTAERVRVVPDELALRKPDPPTRRKSHTRSFSASKLKAGNSFEREEVDGAAKALMYKCSMVVWEAPSACVLQRMEEMSGREVRHMFRTQSDPHSDDSTLE